MLPVRVFCLLSLLTLGGLNAAETSPARPVYRDYFAEWLGQPKSEVRAKLDAAWKHFFYGNDQEERLYYPVAPDGAYIADTGHDDVRSEGMSYGMMIAVQTNHREEFDRLWKWARSHMYHRSGPRRGYFAWQCKFDGTHIDPGSASDGEEWIIMALFFASHRWGDGEGIFNYSGEAQALLEAVRNDQRGEGIRSIFNLQQKQVTFAPTDYGASFTDPSYHLPAFYELWARWAKSDRAFWSEVTQVSRASLKKFAHPKTGLMPEYANYDGTPRPGYPGAFRFDAFRTIANVAVDHAWWGVDPWQVEQTNRVLGFLRSQGPTVPNQYTLDGKPLSEESSPGLIAMAAVGALAGERALAEPFVQQLWDMPRPTGKYRYYDGLLYYLALLQVSGEFRIYAPPTS